MLLESISNTAKSLCLGYAFPLTELVHAQINEPKVVNTDVKNGLCQPLPDVSSISR